MEVCFVLIISLLFAPSVLSRAAIAKRQAETDQDFPLTCEVREYNFNLTLTDSSGKQCSAYVNTFACYGSCDTWEYGDASFPNRQSNNDVCMYDQTEQRTVTLNDCDNGADQTIRSWTFPEAVSCSCKPCDPSRVQCQSRSKRTTLKPLHEPRFVNSGSGYPSQTRQREVVSFGRKLRNFLNVWP